MALSSVLEAYKQADRQNESLLRVIKSHFDKNSNQKEVAASPGKIEDSKA